MILNKIEIESFGKFKDFSMDFSDGINVLCGLNESGKSTICAFLYAMFYDLPSSKQKYTLREDLRKRYTPWSGGDMKGSVYFTHEGKKYVLKRKMGKTPKSTKINLYDGETWEEIKDERSENPGEAFFGIGEDGFLKTIYISQLGAPISRGKNDEIIERLSNLKQSGDEDVSYQKTVDVLTKQKHSLISVGGGAGKIVKLKAENEELKKSLEDVLRAEESYKNAMLKKADEEKKKDELLKKKDDLLKQKESEDEYEKYQVFVKTKKDIEKLCEKKEKLLKDFESSCENLKEANERKKELMYLDNIEENAPQILSELEAQNLVAEQKLAEIEKKKKEAKQTEDEIEKLKDKKQRKINLPLLIAAVLTFVLSLVLAFAVSVWLIFIIAAAIVLFAFSLMPLKGYKEKEKQIAELILKAQSIKPSAEEEAEILSEQKKNKEKAESILSAAHCLNLSELLKKRSERFAMDELLKSAQKENEMISENLKTLDEEIKDLEEELKDADFSEEVKSYVPSGAEKINEKLRTLQDDLIDCEKKLTEAETTIKSIEMSEKSSSAIKTQIGINEETIERLYKTYNATEKALKLIEESYEDLKSDFAPLLSLKVKDAVEKLTGGKYTDVRISDDYTLKVLQKNEIIDADFLSGGTYDSLYLALRLGILKILFDDEVPFLILDDTFLQFDDERTKMAADYIKNEKIKQVFYFTCHREQTKIFGNDNVNVIEF